MAYFSLIVGFLCYCEMFRSTHELCLTSIFERKHRLLSISELVVGVILHVIEHFKEKT